MIEISGLTKRYGATIAVDDLSLKVRPGQVTGVLGPNGAGKTTTLRILMGLARPDSGTALIEGRRYVDLPQPLHTVGCLLDARAVHGGRTGRQHLRWIARSNGIGKSRVEEVLALVDLTDDAGRTVRGYSLGMGQRLGLAAALLGDPSVIILDEPTNGLDAEGIVLVRTLLRSLADEGRTVLVSSHLMAEMARTADHLVVIGRGRLLADRPTDAFLAEARGSSIVVTSATPDRLLDVLRTTGWPVAALPDGSVEVTGGATPEDIGTLAMHHGLVLLGLTRREGSLEDAFLDLTSPHEHRDRHPGTATRSLPLADRTPQ